MSAPYNAVSTDQTIPALQGSNAAGSGVQGEAQTGTGVLGTSNSGVGVWGGSQSSTGVGGESDTGVGVQGVSKSGPGVRGDGGNGVGVIGFTTSQDSQVSAVRGENLNGAGIGVIGVTRSGTGVLGTSTTGVAVWGGSQSSTGVGGMSESGLGVQGVSQTNAGVQGNSPSGRGVAGFSDTWQGVYGFSKAQAGVVGESNNFDGVFGISHDPQHAGVSGHNPGGLAGYFDGNVTITGDVFLTGGDCAEQFDVLDVNACDPGTVMVITNRGGLMPSQDEYDRRVAGVVSGAGDLRPGIILGDQSSTDKRRPIALVGKAFCKAVANAEAISVGDLLTTSTIAGHAMKATDPSRAFGAVIGKALQPLPTGAGLIRILITLQ
jgi:hypothetical protein